MSKYKRDDKTFRAQIAALADAGLKFPTAPTTTRGMSEATDYLPTRRGHFNLPGIVAGLVMGVIVGAIIGIVIAGAIVLVGAH